MKKPGGILKKFVNLLPQNLQRVIYWNRLFFSTVAEPFTPHPHRIIIDITTACDISCMDCNRSCAANQAPARDHMTPGQIKKFIAESIRCGRLWCGFAGPLAPEQNGIRVQGGGPRYEGLRIEGGEPTLNPAFQEIIALLAEYKKRSGSRTNFVLCTNGYSRESGKQLENIPAGISIYNSKKQSRVNDHHCAFNAAPVDSPAFKGHDFSNGCWLPMYYGLGLTRHGYYPHPICGGIDRVLGFDIGLKSLPPPDYSWKEHYRILCRYCGHYNRYTPAGPVRYARYKCEQGRMSPSWQKAYADYRMSRPQLSCY